jgi:hypothetical protein
VGVIVFHIGMPKAGSTSLQLWLAGHRELLRDRGLECMRIVQYAVDDLITLVPISDDDVTSKFVANEPEERPDAVRRLCDALDTHAHRNETVVLTSESYEVLFSMDGRRSLLPYFDELARSHELRIAYYVRPQHTWLESAWLQWGFRISEVTPSMWCLYNGKRLDYFRTLQVVRECAPNVEFRVRPFRTDLLHGGDIGSDFAKHVLGLTDTASTITGEHHANRSLPLEVAVLLRDEPTGAFWSSLSDNKRLYALKELLLAWDLPNSDALERSRLVLQWHSLRRYEFGNRKLIAEMGWDTEFFVPPLAQPLTRDDAKLDELDTLWQSKASPAERRIALRALQELLTARGGSSRQAPATAPPPSEAIVTHHSIADLARALRRRTRALALAGFNRARGGRLSIAPPKSNEHSSFARLRFTNTAAAGTFEAVAAVRPVGERSAPKVYGLPWHDSQPSADVGRGETASLQFAVGRRGNAGAILELFALGAADDKVVRVPLAPRVELSVVVRRSGTDRIVADRSAVIELTARGDEPVLVVRPARVDPLLRRAAGSSPVSPTPPVPPSSPRPWHPRVVDVAPDVGLGLSTRTFGAVVFDANGDGWPDIFLGRHDGPAFLFRNEQGRFVRDTTAEFPGVDRHCGAAGDLTGDGRLDLFCVIGGASGHESKGAANELWLQQPDGSFVDHGEQPGLADPYGRGREAVLFDATGNGRLDILVGNVSPRSDGKPSPNRLFLNEGDGCFRPAPEFGLDVEYSVGGAGRIGSPHGGGNWPMGRLATLDARGRGWTDVVMSATAPGDDVQRVHLFHNDDGRGFHDVTADVGLAGIDALDVAVADMTGDGQPDLVIVNRAGLTICLNDHGQYRVAHQMPIDDAFRVAVADASGDGQPDIYVMRTKGVPADDVPDLLLLSRGTYDDYEAVTLPTVDGIVRDDAVYAIDYDRDGRSEFLVLHGHSPHAAAIQLIALR